MSRGHLPEGCAPQRCLEHVRRGQSRRDKARAAQQTYSPPMVKPSWMQLKLRRCVLQPASCCFTPSKVQMTLWLQKVLTHQIILGCQVMERLDLYYMCPTDVVNVALHGSKHIMLETNDQIKHVDNMHNMFEECTRWSWLICQDERNVLGSVTQAACRTNIKPAEYGSAERAFDPSCCWILRDCISKRPFHH